MPLITFIYIKYSKYANVFLLQKFSFFIFVKVSVYPQSPASAGPVRDQPPAAGGQLQPQLPHLLHASTHNLYI